jgi:hypothetical protein
MNGIIKKGGKRYFLTLIDDASRFCASTCSTKDEALEYFKLYNAEVENQLDKKIKRLQSDKGGEYIFNISLLENWYIVTVKYGYNKIIFVYIQYDFG